LDRFLDIVRQTVDELGPDDSQLMALVYPYRRHLTGDDELEDLRRNLEQVHQSKETLVISREDEKDDDDDDDDEP
jgi:hypothetical protein